MVAESGTGRSAQLRRLLESCEEPIPAAGVYDPLSARRAAQAGFRSVFVTGRGVARALFDEQLVYVRDSDAEAYTDYVRHLCAATTVPVIADAEDGFGDPLRTCQALERAGAAAVTLQDGSEHGGFLPADQMTEAIRAVRRETDLVVVGRTDLLGTARAEAIERLRAYRAAGAELVMAALSDVPEEAVTGSALLVELAAAAGSRLVVHSRDGRRLLPTSALPSGVRIVLVTAAVVDHATATIDRTLREIIDLATPAK